MAEIRIPEEYERGFVEIRALDETQIAEFLSALADESPTLNREDLQSRVASKVEGSIARGDLDRIMETLSSLYGLRDSMGIQTVSEFADIVCEAMDLSDVEELWFEDEKERESFRERLIRLLNVDSLDVAARAVDLLNEHEHTIHGKGRVLSDIRPIFGPDPDAPPKGAVVTHELKLSYHENRGVKEFFITLDSVQVDELIEVLERAKAKGESLKRMLGESGVPHIEVD